MLRWANADANSDTDSWRNADAHAYTSADRAISDAHPGPRIDIHFLDRDFHVERRNCDVQFPFHRHFAAQRQYLQLWNNHGSFENRNRYSY
jgi:hypothetical protein